MPILKKIFKGLLIRVKFFKERNNLKLLIGAGDTTFPGWIITDQDFLDITNKSDWAYIFGRNYKINNILAEHVVEHLYFEEFCRFLTIAKNYLNKNGKIRIAVPDGNHPSEYVKELTRPGGTDPGSDDHKYFYTILVMQDVANNLGYKLDALEYFDENGLFYAKEYDERDGFISRSSKHYEGRFTNSAEEYQKMYNSIPLHLQNQFLEKNISYTSLLVDFVKA